MCVRACCVACVRACVCACVRARARMRQRSRIASRLVDGRLELEEDVDDARQLAQHRYVQRRVARVVEPSRVGVLALRVQVLTHRSLVAVANSLEQCHHLRGAEPDRPRKYDNGYLELLLGRDAVQLQSLDRVGVEGLGLLVDALANLKFEKRNTQDLHADAR
eukprot:326570-Pleurochrysis_carterae.AAC.4